MSSAQSGTFSKELGDRSLNDTNRLPYDVLPLNSPSGSYHNLAVYPPRPPITSQLHGAHYDPEQAHAPPHSQSFIKKEHEVYQEHEAGRRAHLVSVDGGAPKTKVGKLYNFLLNASIVTRWTLFIVPVLGIIWIPGILSFTTYPHAAIWSVRLLFWSIWLSIVWAGWWGALATALILPRIIKSTVGVVAVSTRRYIDWMQALHRYNALFAWAIVIWVSFNPIIDIHQVHPGPKSAEALSLLARLLFAFLLCAGALFFEKFSIQWIAGNFHERSYAERIADQKFAVHSLVKLYRHSRNISRADTLHVSTTEANAPHMDAKYKRFFRKFRHGVRFATTTTATVFGNVASEIAGSSVLQPNSPGAIIKTALESVNKSRLLARRLFYSFVKKDSELIFVEDFEPFFPTKEEAAQVFALFDQDSNRDVSRDEMENACLEFHREQLSIEHSMQDLDSAVGRLDNILMTVYCIVAILIIAVALEAQLLTLVTGAGTLILGLSWLIGSSLQEVLASIIFLFIKHPFDVGDRVVINKETYTVKEIRLLSTVFLDSTSGIVQAANNQLNTLFIQNIRRSPEMSESFVFDVAYSTTFKDLERLREKMLEFVKVERRDYQPVFDVTVKDFPEQTKMVLSADIKYKSNGQQAAIKAKRRNKWICALKTALEEVKIYGPSGDPDTAPVSRYTKVPWSIIHGDDQQVGDEKKIDLDVHHSQTSRWQLGDENAAILDSADDVFGDPKEFYMKSPQRSLSSHLNVVSGPTKKSEAPASQ